MQLEYFKVEQRKPEPPKVKLLDVVKNWSIAAEVDTQAEAEAEVQRLHDYDAYYSLKGWEYRITPAKRKAPRK